jgi:peroxiredoxin
MAKRTTTKPAAPPRGSTPRSIKPSTKQGSAAAQQRDRWPIVVAVLVVALLSGLYVVYQAANKPHTSGATPGSDYQVGSPGPGAKAPDFALPSTKGGTVNLAAYKGKTALLYFHEGIGCQPCWDQIRDLEKSQADLKAAGVDDFVAITTGPVELVGQKVTDDRLTATNLADPDLAVSRAYQANKYGMMGNDRDGHTFILVGPVGTISWRADYGGAPKYTMYVPVPQLLTDLRAGVTR